MCSMASSRDIYDVTPILQGDFNQSGTVDTEDYGLWRSNVGSTTEWQADHNRDGVVGLADYTLWRDNMGSVDAPMARHYQTVPEPGGCVLLTAAPMIWGLGRRLGKSLSKQSRRASRRSCVPSVRARYSDKLRSRQSEPYCGVRCLQFSREMVRTKRTRRQSQAARRQRIDSPRSV